MITWDLVPSIANTECDHCPSFLVDVLTCPHCGGRRRLLAFIMKPSAIERILSHLGLPRSHPRFVTP